MKYFHIYGEGRFRELGFNFYPWASHKYSIGFILKLRFFSRFFYVGIRYAPYIKKLYFPMFDTWTEQDLIEYGRWETKEMKLDRNDKT